MAFSLKNAAEVFARCQGHDDEERALVGPNVIHFHNMWMTERGRGPRLLLETGYQLRVLRELLVEQLYGDGTPKLLVAGSIDGRHSALAESLFNDIATGKNVSDSYHAHPLSLGWCQTLESDTPTVSESNAPNVGGFQ